jgi:hypothetical protein
MRQEKTQQQQPGTCQKVRKTTDLTTANLSSGLKGASSSCVPM